MQYTHFGCIFIRQSIALQLRRRHKAKANLQCTDKAQNNSETRVRALFALYKNFFFSISQFNAGTEISTGDQL